MAAGPPKNPFFTQPNGFKVAAVPIGKGIGNNGDWKMWTPEDMSGVVLDTAKLQAMPVDAHECEGYTEHCDENGLEASRVFQVPWSQAADFTQWAYGYSYSKLVSGTVGSTTAPPVYKLYRVIPCQDWYRPYLYCDHVQLEQGQGKCVPDPEAFLRDARGSQVEGDDGNAQILPAMVYADNLGGGGSAVLGVAAPAFTLADGMARFRVRYRSRGYPVRNDADAEAHPLVERSRYVSVKRDYAIQAMPLAKTAIAGAGAKTQLMFVTTAPAGLALALIPEPGVILVPTQTLLVCFHELPYNPDDAIQKCMGKVNANDYTIAPAWGPYTAQTLLCQAPQTRGPYRNAAGAISWDVTFRMEYRPTGWNFYFAPDGQIYFATFGGNLNGATVYKPATFSDLFVPQAPPVW